MRFEYNAVVGVKLVKIIAEKKVSLLSKLHFFYKQPVYKQLALGWQIAK